jgi:hypothetical protein
MPAATSLLSLPTTSADTQTPITTNESSVNATKPPSCEICNLSLSPTNSNITDLEYDTPQSSTKPRPHEASLAHQVCLTHSHPPSHLDRSRKGLTYLSSYGWDPDSRLGLGAFSQGIAFPIKAKQKDDKMGLGLVFPEEKEWRKKEKVEKLDAKKVRKLEEQDRRRREELQELFYRSDDLERYLRKG